METTARQRSIPMRQRKTNALRVAVPLTYAWLILGLFLMVSSARAQQRAPMTPESESGRSREQLAQATRQHKANLGQLLSLYEADAKSTEERLSKVKELCTEGLVTRRDMKIAEDMATRAREKVAETQAQLKGIDVQVAKALVETEAEEASPKLRVNPPVRAVSGFIHTTAYIRYGGGVAWSLSEVGPIKQFFLMRFGRALPIHVFGQSPLHDRWGYDHRNAMDIGLSPDSVEGQALIEYLRANSIPFTGFHFAIPGVATGPHIHVGLPSHRTVRALVATNTLDKK